MSTDPRVAELELDVDVRLANVWVAVLECEGDGSNVIDPILSDEGLRDVFAAFLRVAYSVGYNDALREVGEGRAGELNRRHGYLLPT